MSSPGFSPILQQEFPAPKENNSQGKPPEAGSEGGQEAMLAVGWLLLTQLQPLRHFTGTECWELRFPQDPFPPFSWFFFPPPDFPVWSRAAPNLTWVCPHLAPTSEMQNSALHRVWGKYWITPCKSQHFQVIPVQQEGAGNRDRLAGDGEQESLYQITTFLSPHHLFQSRKG